MPEETIKKAEQGLEILGLTLLLSTNSSLNKKWLKSKTKQEAAALPDKLKLGFTPSARAAAMKFLQDNFESRAVFSGFGQLHQMFYGVPGEHPPIGDARKIIASLQAMDNPKPRGRVKK